MPSAGQDIFALNHQFAWRGVNDDELAITSTSYTAGSVPCGVAFTVPDSGTVTLIWYAYYRINTSNQIFISAGVYSGAVIGSGSAISGSTDTRSLTSESSGDDRAGMAMRTIEGLTPQAVVHARIEARVTGGNGDILNREILVIPHP